MVVATYNVAPYIDAFFDSLLAQTAGLDVLEIIVVNDGSTDGSGAIAAERARRHPDLIRCIDQTNQGVCAARNAGLRAARGDWICFPDPDDVISADYLAQMLEEIDRPQDRPLLAVVANMVSHYEQTGQTVDDHPLRFRFARGVQRRDSTDPGTFVVAHTTSTFMRRAEIAAQDLWFDPAVRPSFEDAHFIMRLAIGAPGRTISFLPGPVYTYRKRAAQDSLMNNVAQDRAWFAPHLRTAYLPLIAAALAQRGRVPVFVQCGILVSLLGKLRHLTGPHHDPDRLDDAQKRAFLDAMAEVMAHIDAQTIREVRLRGLKDMHRIALLGREKGARLSPLPVTITAVVPQDGGLRVQLRWFSGGTDRITVALTLDGTIAPVTEVTQTRTDLLGTPYLCETALWVQMAEGQVLAGRVDGADVVFRRGGTVVGSQVTATALAGSADGKAV